MTSAAKAGTDAVQTAALKGCATQERITRLLLLSIFLLFFASPLFARSWRVADYNDAITISLDGSAAVQERITLNFVGEWHGIHRFIPVEYPGPRGTNYTLFLNVTGVTDGNGGKLKYESSSSNGLSRPEDLHSQSR